MKRLLFLLALPGLLAAAPVQHRLTDFGAVPDDGLDDSAALQLALQAAAADGEAVLVVPPGEYDILARVVLDASFSFLRIEGRGHNISRLIGRNGDGVLRIACPNPDAVLEIADLDIVPSQPAAGTGLELSKPYSAPTGPGHNLLLGGLEMRCADRLADYFDRWIVADGWMPLVENVMASGPFGPGITAAERSLGTSALVLSNAYKPRIRNCGFWSARQGVVVGLADAHDEPVFANSVSVGTAEGIRIHKVGTAPFTAPVRVVDAHWNNETFGLLLENLDAFEVLGSVPYFQYEEGFSSTNYADIEAVGCTSGKVEGCIFWYNGFDVRTPVRIGAGCGDIAVRHNHIARNIARQAFDIAPDAWSFTAQGNMYGLYALDEDGTFGLWHMDEDAGGTVADAALLDPARSNPLVLSGGAAIAEWRPNDDLHQPALVLDPGGAASTLAWPGAPGIEVMAIINIVSAGAIMEIPGVFRLESTGSDLLCTFSLQGGGGASLQVADGAPVGTRWRRIRARLDPATGEALLEVDGTGRDRAYLPGASLPAVQQALRLGSTVSGTAFRGALDQLRFTVLGSETTGVPAPYVWNGAAAPDGRWSAGNWIGAAPTNGFNGHFQFGGTLNLSATNDLAGGMAASLAFAPGAGTFTLHGNAMALAGGVSNESGTVQSVMLGLDLVGAVPVLGDLVLGGTMEGTGGLHKPGSGTLAISGANGYAGGTFLVGGTLAIGADAALGSGPVAWSGGTLCATDGNERRLANDIDIVGSPVTLGVPGNRLELAGAIDLGPSTRTLVVVNAANNGNFAAKLSGPVSGWGGLAKEGTGFLNLNNAANTFAGGVALREGTLVLGVNNALGTGAFTIKGGRLATQGIQTRNVTNDVVVKGGFAMQAGGANAFLRLNGPVDLDGGVRDILLAGPGTKEINGAASNGGLSFSTDAAANGRIALGGANTYGGDTTVSNEVAFTLAGGGTLAFAIGANGVNNQIRGSGAAVLEGAFAFDLSGADETAGNAWQIVGPALLANTVFSNTFAVADFTDAGDGTWTQAIDGSKHFAFSEATGVLSVVSTAPPVIGEVSFEYLPGTGLLLSWPNTVGTAYGVQTNIDLVHGGWGWLQSNLAGAGSSLSFTGETAAAQTYFRIVVE